MKFNTSNFLCYGMIVQALLPFRVRAFSPPISRADRATRVFSQGRDYSVGIVGGGLAGLATAFHLIERNPEVCITIIDKASPGTGGASSVAGGLLHPLTPRGKLAYLGLEGLQATKRLIDAASEFKKGVILRDEIFRMALNEDHELALKQAASTLPDWTEWTEASDLEWDTPSSLIGALRIHSGGGKVVHVPTYLQGLWTACKMKGTGKKVWRTEPDFATDGFDWKERLSVFDSVVLCAGSGLFQDSIVTDDMPIQLVRGQSVELFLGDRTLQHARLCGKYASPLPESNRILIGATHEFKSEPLDKSEVETELQKRTNSFASDLWDGSTIDKITTGFRVQSNRGKNGRIPIIGKFKSLLHSDAWIFTGLSSRGLLYHGVFGETLANMILNVECGENSISHDDLEWWLETK